MASKAVLNSQSGDRITTLEEEVANMVPLGGITRLAPTLGVDVTLGDKKFVQANNAVTNADPSLAKTNVTPMTTKLYGVGTMVETNIVGNNDSGTVMVFENLLLNKGLISTDYGETWSVLTGVNFTSSKATAIKEANGTWILTSTGGPFYRSVNGGATWTGYGGTYNIKNLATDGNGNWLAGVFNTNTVVQSLNDGLTWTARGIAGFGGSDQVVVETDRNGLWIAAGGSTSSSSTRLSKSTDNGTTWTAITDRPSLTNYIFNSLATNRQGVWLTAASASTSVISTIVKSVDNGATWRAIKATGLGAGSVNNLIFINNNTWVATTESNNLETGLYISHNDGESWSILEIGRTPLFQAISADSENLYIGIDDGSGVAKAAKAKLGFGIEINSSDSATYYVRYQ